MGRIQACANGHAIKRFTRVDRVNHAFVIVTFFGLALTGMPLLYSEKAWAQHLANLLGGARLCGIEPPHLRGDADPAISWYMAGRGRRFKKHGIKAMLFGPTTMLATRKDLSDCIGMFKWFLQAAEAQVDRWTYWEKFDYMPGGRLGHHRLKRPALWFPVFFGQFVPGWAFNAAMGGARV